MAGGHTRALSELRAADAARYGGKSASLGELLAGEVPVPPGFALVAAAFDAHVDGASLRAPIEERLGGAGEGVDALQDASREIGELIRGVDMPAAVAEELAGLLPDARLHVYDRPSVLWTKRKELRERISSFLNG